jgi:hypothetical protein
MQIRGDTDRFSPVMSSNQLPEIVVGSAGPPHPRRISKLSRKYWRDKHRLQQESIMPVIPVNPNHPAASATRSKRTPIAAVRESPPRAAKERANNALMQHGASASPPRCPDVASVAVASVATDAGEKTDAAKNAAGLASALAGSTATIAAAADSSNDSSNSEDSDMIGGCDILPPSSPSGDDYE